MKMIECCLIYAMYCFGVPVFWECYTLTNYFWIGQLFVFWTTGVFILPFVFAYRLINRKEEPT